MRHPKLSIEQYQEYQRVKAQLQRRLDAANRCEPYEHRPWDRGYNIYEGEPLAS